MDLPGRVFWQDAQSPSEPVLRSKEIDEGAFGSGSVERRFPGGHEAVEKVEEVAERLTAFAVGGTFPREEEFSRFPVVEAGDETHGPDHFAGDLGHEDDAERAQEVVIGRAKGFRSASRLRASAICPKFGVAGTEISQARCARELEPRQMVSRARSSRPGRNTVDEIMRSSHNAPAPTAGLQDPAR